MGYACPVCEDPQADAGHLANHLAFTALLGDDAHGAWLDDHVPGWGGMDEAELADALREDVDETEFPQVFEDTVGGLSESAEPPEERSGALFEDSSRGDEHGHGHGNEHGAQSGDGAAPIGGARDAPDVTPVEPADPADEETAAIIEEAREMTREMMGMEEPSDDDGAEERFDTDGADESEADGAAAHQGVDDDPDAETGGDDPDAEAGGDDPDAETGGDDPGDGNENE